MKKPFVYFLLIWVCSASGAEIKINFGDLPEDQPPTNDFHGALAGGGRPGNWSIVMDEVPSAFPSLSTNSPAFNRTTVLAQLDADPTDERFPMLIYDKQTFKDFKLATQFKIVGGALEQMAGVVFRFQDESNFYVLRASALGHNVRFYKVVNAQRGNLIGPPMDISIGVWHTLAVQCEGNQITCWLDGKLVMPPLQDDTFTSGKIGFWTKSDSLTHFGDTSITYTPVVPPAETLVRSVMEEQPRLLDLRIYMMDSQGKPRVIAAKDKNEIGLQGTDAEKGAIENGSVYVGRGKGTVAVTMPLDDRDGDPIAAVRVRMPSFLWETEDTALTRARAVIQVMQAQVLSSKDLVE